MRLDKNTRLSDLQYGHGDKFVCSLSGKFRPEKYPDATAIEIGQLKCGCWIVVDGNNRIGLMLRSNPDATVHDIPPDMLCKFRYGEWDNEHMEYWNPSPRSFGIVMKKKTKRDEKKSNDQDTDYGMIERIADREFHAVSIQVKLGLSVSASGRSIDETKTLLERQIKKKLKQKNVTLVLSPLTPLEDHVCHGKV